MAGAIQLDPKQLDPIRRWAPLVRGALAAGGRLPAVAFEAASAPLDAETALLSDRPGEPDAALATRLREAVAAHAAEHGHAPRRISVPCCGVFTALAPPAGGGRVAGKVVLVSGAAQGFGLEIATALATQGARVALADVNLAGAREAANRLCSAHGEGVALALAMDVGDAASVAAAFDALLAAWGGLDLLVANAGVLRAGGLDQLDEADFDFVTRVNYNGYYLSVRAAAPILARQHLACPGVWSDIIQINSKSGLEGSKRNFAYAGAKFGGIGLTQSFALELVEHGIKVNAICPGNFFDGPLWSDPENGLFVQYLKTGKVPGATTIDDVRRFYEAKVPMGRGCTGPDVMRAIHYLVEQQYETGQALPVTGGQVMLG